MRKVWEQPKILKCIPDPSARRLKPSACFQKTDDFCLQHLRKGILENRDSILYEIGDFCFRRSIQSCQRVILMLANLSKIARDDRVRTLIRTAITQNEGYTAAESDDYVFRKLTRSEEFIHFDQKRQLLEELAKRKTDAAYAQFAKLAKEYSTFDQHIQRELDSILARIQSDPSSHYRFFIAVERLQIPYPEAMLEVGLRNPIQPPRSDIVAEVQKGKYSEMNSFLPACQQGEVAWLEKLIEKYPELPTQVCFADAVSHQRWQLIKLLVKKTADLNYQRPCPADEKACLNNTPLMTAVEKGDVNLVRYLLQQAGTKPRIKRQDGKTAEQLAKDLGFDLIAKDISARKEPEDP